MHYALVHPDTATESPVILSDLMNLSLQMPYLLRKSGNARIIEPTMTPLSHPAFLRPAHLQRTTYLTSNHQEFDAMNTINKSYQITDEAIGGCTIRSTLA